MRNCLFLKGKLKFLILQTLNKEPLHAYAIRKQISELSDNLFVPSFGSLYPALDDLLEKKYITMKQGKKKIYSISENGKKYLNELRDEFKNIEKQVLKVLKGSKFDINPEEMMNIFIAQHKISAKISLEYLPELIKFFNNYNKGILKKIDIKKYENELKNTFEAVKKINKTYSD
jgi:DNA-binding PadR family transcriptional regulator